MMDISSLGGPFPRQLLDSFNERATQGKEVRVEVDGQSYMVLAQGTLATASGNARSVAWVQGDVDTTHIFVNAMSQTYGARVSDSITKELGLEPSPGKPLASRLVQQALEMAKISQEVLGGVDFLTALEHSAVAGGRGFHQAVSVLNLDSKSMTAQTRMELDAHMQAKFAQANANGQSPVAAEVASAWLKGLLSGQAARPV